MRNSNKALPQNVIQMQTSTVQSLDFGPMLDSLAANMCCCKAFFVNSLLFLHSFCNLGLPLFYLGCRLCLNNCWLLFIICPIVAATEVSTVHAEDRNLFKGIWDLTSGILAMLFLHASLCPCENHCQLSLSLRVGQSKTAVESLRKG